MKSLGQEFKEFILRGNVVSLAVAVVVGAAFTAIVTAFTEHFIMPLIALIGGQPDMSGIAFKINDTTFGIGHILNAVIYFLIVSFIVFFMVVKPMNHLMERGKKEEPVDDTMTRCPYCTSEVSKEATRCPHCTSELAAQVI